MKTAKNNLIDEANCIGTAILRADIYPDSLKNEFKKDFKSCLYSRRDYCFLDNNGGKKLTASLQQASITSKKLWNRATLYAKNKEYFIQSTMMLPELYAMFDGTSKSNLV